jgi:hypothetical protein
VDHVHPHDLHRFEDDGGRIADHDDSIAQPRTAGPGTSPREIIKDRIRELGKLPYGHDGHDALPMRDDARTFALDSVFMSETRGVNLWGVTDPVVSLNPNGTIGIDLHDEVSGRNLSLLVPCQGVVEYVQRFPDDETAITGCLVLPPDGLFEDIDRAIDWLIGTGPRPAER